MDSDSDNEGPSNFTSLEELARRIDENNDNDNDDDEPEDRYVAPQPVLSSNNRKKSKRVSFSEPIEQPTMVSYQEPVSKKNSILKPLLYGLVSFLLVANPGTAYLIKKIKNRKKSTPKMMVDDDMISMLPTSVKDTTDANSQESTLGLTGLGIQSVLFAVIFGVLLFLFN